MSMCVLEGIKRVSTFTDSVVLENTNLPHVVPARNQSNI